MKNWEQYLKAHHPASIRSQEIDYCEEVRRAISRVSEYWDKNGSLLCVGCGDGFEMGVFQEKGFAKVVGVTNDERELHAVSNAEIKMILADMHDTDFPSNHFDYLYSKEALEHSIAPYPLLCELNRIMKIGGEFLHFISSGMEKQREIYHYSAFPDWLWFDLFYKTGFEVKIIYENPVQLGFCGTKKENKGFDKIPEHLSYDLQGELNKVRRVKFDL